MGPDEVLRQRFIGGRGLERGLGQHPRLQRQKITEDAGKRHHHVDARAAKFGQRDQVGPRQSAIMVEPRPCPHQRQRLGDRPAVGLDVVRPPQDQCHCVRKRGVHVEQSLRLRGTVLHREGGGHAEGVEGVDVAAGRQDLWRADQVAAGNRSDEAGREGAQDPGQFGLVLQNQVRLGTRLGIVGHERDHLGPRLSGHLAANDMEAIGDQGAFSFQKPDPKLIRCQPGHVHGPGLLGHQRFKICPLGCIRGRRAPAGQRVLQVDKTLVKP